MSPLKILEIVNVRILALIVLNQFCQNGKIVL